jgi:flagellar hook-basal body complex protein FliE
MSTLFGIPGVTSTVGLQQLAGVSSSSAASSTTAVGGDKLKLARLDPRHFTAGGGTAELGQEKPLSFEDSLLKAMDGVNAMQNQSSSAIEQSLIDPDSIDAHDVTIAMAKANMSLNITRTVLERIVGAWKDIINTR